MAATLIDQWVASHGPLQPFAGPTGNAPTPAEAAAVVQANTSQHFRARVIMAATTAALAISSETSTTPDHANRVALAKQVLNAPDNFTYAFAQALASQSIDDTSTDAQINVGVASVWNGMAG